MVPEGHTRLQGSKKLVEPPSKRPEEGSTRGSQQAAMATSTAYSRHLVMKVTLHKLALRVMIDSGATGNYLSAQSARRHQIPTQRKQTPYPLKMIDGTPVKGKGEVDEETSELTLWIKGHEEKIKLDLVDFSLYDLILGIPWLEKHNPEIDWGKRTMQFPRCNCTNTTPFEGVVWARPQGNALAATQQLYPPEYADFAELFQEGPPGTTLPKHQPWDHEIPLQPGTSPSYGPIYSLSERELEALREYLDEHLKKGYIRPSTSPAGYPILFIPKKDGSLRLCVDYRHLNAITIKNRYALPLISELQDRIRGSRVFTTLDLRGAYNLVRMKQGEEWKTAFRTRYGHYEYLVMPFGLTNAPASFQALINQVLREYLDEFVVAYLDDILIYSPNPQEHTQHVRKVLRKLKAANLFLKPEKCEFSQKRVKYLGSILSEKGISMDPDKVKAILEWPTPENVTEVQSFLGFANFYRRFIEGYSKVATALTELTKKDRKFHWGETCHTAFHLLKRRFTTAPILATFDPEKHIVLETDASDFAIGMCISQPDEKGRLHPVAYHSRKMSPAELNYEIHDKELLAIVEAFKEWRAYLEGSKYQVEVKTDHKNLVYFTTTN